MTPEDVKAIVEALEAICSAISALIFTVGVFGCLLIWTMGSGDAMKKTEKHEG